MLLGQELKFKNKLCNLKLGTFFSALLGELPGFDKDERNRLASMLTTMIEDGQSVMCDSKKLYEEAMSQSLHLQRCSAFLRRK